MRKHFAEALVSGCEPLIGTLELPGADDRHVLAAAIRCDAQFVVTDNLADLPAEILAKFDIDAIDADEFLFRTFDLCPSEAPGVLRTPREAYSNPPFTPSGFVRELTAKGLPRLAGQIRERQDELERNAPRPRSLCRLRSSIPVSGAGRPLRFSTRTSTRPAVIGVRSAGRSLLRFQQATLDLSALERDDSIVNRKRIPFAVAS